MYVLTVQASLFICSHHTFSQSFENKRHNIVPNMYKLWPLKVSSENLNPKAHAFFLQKIELIWA